MTYTCQTCLEEDTELTQFSVGYLLCLFVHFTNQSCISVQNKWKIAMFTALLKSK